MTATFEEISQVQRRRSRQRDAHQQWHGITVIDDLGTAQSYLEIVKSGEEQLAGIEKYLGELRDRNDAADARHAAITAPLLAEIENKATTTERRIECRKLIQEATSQLKVAVDETNALIEAAEFEREVARGSVSGRSVIENAFARGGTPEAQERRRILERVESLGRNFLFDLEKKVEKFAIQLEDLREREAKKEPRHRDAFALAEAERNAAHWSAVAAMLGKPVDDAVKEKNEMRERRLAELYGNTEQE
jgi:hypothetical protein